MRYAIGEEVQSKCAARKLTNLGTVVGQCGVINCNEAIKNMEWKLQFVSTIAETNRDKLVDEMRKKEQKKLQFDELAPKAAANVEKHGRNMDTLTVKELEALSIVVFSLSISGSGLQKSDYVRKLKKPMEDSIAKYDAFILLHGISAAGGGGDGDADAMANQDATD
jgi:hypothetical protein